MLVANRRLGMSEPFAVASAVWQATGRIVRVLGVPDIAPIGPVLRRMGAVQDRPDELAGVLRAGQLALVFLDRQLRMGARVGQIGRDAMVPAVELGVPVLPVAVTGRELSRQLASAGRRTSRRPHRDRCRSARGRRDDRRGPRGDPRDHRPPLVSRATASDGTRLAFDVFGRPGGAPVLLIQGLGADRTAGTAPARRARRRATERSGWTTAGSDDPTSRRVATTSTSWPTMPLMCSTRAGSTRRT